MRMFEKISTTASTSGTVGASEPSGYTTSVPTATDAQQSGSSVAPGNYGDTFVDSPEPGVQSGHDPGISLSTPRRPRRR
jgi:hypothetical protein